MHAGEKPYGCKECGKRLSSNPALTRHWRIHTRERPFECKECGKVFRQKTTLVRQEQVHTGEKPYECKVCGKTFSWCGRFILHQKPHTQKACVQEKGFLQLGSVCLSLCLPVFFLFVHVITVLLDCANNCMPLSPMALLTGMSASLPVPVRCLI